MCKDCTITTYEKHLSALHYGDLPIIAAYRVKNYKLRKRDEINTHSLRRLERLIGKSVVSYSDTSEHWFRTVHPIRCKHDRNINGMYETSIEDYAHEAAVYANTLAGKARQHSRNGEVYYFAGPYVFKVTSNRITHTSTGWWGTPDRWGSFRDAITKIIYYQEKNKHEYKLHQAP